MRYPQWIRAKGIVELMREIEENGHSIRQNRNAIQLKIAKKYNWCHDCLLLAVYGFYKNGYITSTGHQREDEIDYTGFDGNFSIDIRHAFNALGLLEDNEELKASDIKKELGGEASIYSFVKYYHQNNLLNLE